ncbi:hypothetical protein RvY_07770 [Ramazzottius varieornatus]|uniref:DM10 domain-containing protein n=1 Tax=Ramazzottius varieornatus TaxID=947166 RepID=A0A1D1V9F0_RAMVA|nr:hypothetical protein RvY_07770 [Ramazzottius varieornatus]
MPNGRHPIQNYQLFDQAQFPENVAVFTDVDLQCGREICVFGRSILLTDCDDFTKWFYRHRYQKEQEAIHMPDSTDAGKYGKVCPYNQHGSEEDSILNCQKLRPLQPLTDLRKYLLVDQDFEDPNSLVFSVKMITDDAIDGSRNFIMTYSLNDDGVCVKERVGAGRRNLRCCSDLYLPPSFFDEYEPLTERHSSSTRA